MELRPLRAFRQADRNLKEELHAERAAAEAARFEITRSATQFSRRSKEVVDGNINLSAVLMRAGEVDEANRLLAEAEREVRTEKAALIETVAEVRAEGAERRSRITRLKLLKVLATAFLGGSLMMFSVFGVALARFLTDGPPSADAHGSAAPSGKKAVAQSAGRVARRVLVPGTGMRVALTDEQLSEYLRLKNSSDVEIGDLREFLLGIAPQDLVDEVLASIAQGTGDAQGKVDKLLTAVVQEVKEQKPKESPSESPSAQPSESPEDQEATPTPTPSEDEETDDEDGETPDGGSGDKDGDEGGSMLPSPLPHTSQPGDDR
ncbi:MAG: hypothetical protein ACR2L3_04775 [Actinomycetota bacterium]